MCPRKRTRNTLVGTLQSHKQVSVSMSNILIIKYCISIKLTHIITILSIALELLILVPRSH